MKIKRFYAMFMAAAVAVCAFGCGSTAANQSAPEDGTKEAAAETEVTTQAPAQEAAAGSTEETAASENPARKYVGAYKEEGSENFYLLIEVTDNVDGVAITAAQMDPEKPYVQWAMSGKIDDSLRISYTDGIKSELQVTEEQGIEENVVYSDGTGFVQIGADGSVTWQDDKEGIANDIRFILDEELTKEVRARMEEQESLQNPVMNWVGRYHDAENISRTMTISPAADSANACNVIIDEEGEDNAVTRWTMTGSFDEKEKKITGSDCTLMKGTLDDDGNFVEEETVYSDGTGTITFDNSGDKITAVWHSDQSDEEDAVFEFDYNYSEYTSDGSTQEIEDDYTNPEDEYVEEELTVDDNLDDVIYEGEDD